MPRSSFRLRAWIALSLLAGAGAGERGRGEPERAGSARLHTASLLAGMAEGVVAVGLGERVLFMNHSAAELLGLPRELEEGARLWEVLRFPALERALRAALDG